MKVHEAVARAFHAEGVRTQFGLMGDANMLMMLDLAELEGVATYQVRHEHCAVGMAMGYHSATGKIGVASVTCGPGFTQIMTALTTAARANIPIVILAGEAPLSVRGYGQAIDQPPLAAACGAHYVALHMPAAIQGCVNEAFYHAQTQRKPVVLGIPVDVQMMDALSPSYSSVLQANSPLPPVLLDNFQALKLAQKLRSAKRPIILAGRGAVRAKCGGILRALAEESDALLATTLLARGLFDDDPMTLGVIGGYGSAISEKFAKNADLVLAFGTSLSTHTTDGGKLFAGAELIQIDTAPVKNPSVKKGADIQMMADCRLASEALLAQLQSLDPKPKHVRVADIAAQLAARDVQEQFDIAEGEIDPRQAFSVLEREIPRDFDVISGSAHQAYWHAALMRGGDPERYHAIRDFGAIGNSISIAAGVATSRSDGKAVLFEGDGSLIMHIQELETLHRHGVKLLIVICNDGAYGGEAHTLRALGRDPGSLIFGRPDFAAIARAFGLRGETVRDASEIEGLHERYVAGDGAMIVDMHVSRNVKTPRKTRILKAIIEDVGLQGH